MFSKPGGDTYGRCFILTSIPQLVQAKLTKAQALVGGHFKPGQVCLQGEIYAV